MTDLRLGLPECHMHHRRTSRVFKVPTTPVSGSCVCWFHDGWHPPPLCQGYVSVGSPVVGTHPTPSCPDLLRCADCSSTAVWRLGRCTDATAGRTAGGIACGTARGTAGQTGCISLPELLCPWVRHKALGWMQPPCSCWNGQHRREIGRICCSQLAPALLVTSWAEGRLQFS